MSSDSKILVIPDLHTFHGQVEAIIARQKPNVTIFLGDYFDQFGDTPDENVQTAQWLKESLCQPNRVHLLGNHDLHYGYPGRHTFCSGFSPLKYAAIATVLNRPNWERMRLYHQAGGFLFTHAGLHRSFFHESGEHVASFLHLTERKALEALNAGRLHWSFAAGRSRGGSEPHGGLTWCDWGEFEPIPKLNQIFGHTPDWEPRVLEADDSSNVCLDTTMPQGRSIRHFAIVVGGDVEIHPA
jgi:hypothetical protein